MYLKLALSRDVHRVSCLASMVKFTILVIAVTYMSMTCVKNTISSFGTSLPNTFQRPPRDDKLVGVGGGGVEIWLWTMVTHCSFYYSFTRSVSQLSNDEG